MSLIYLMFRKLLIYNENPMSLIYLMFRKLLIYNENPMSLIFNGFYNSLIFKEMLHMSLERLITRSNYSESEIANQK